MARLSARAPRRARPIDSDPAAGAKRVPGLTAAAPTVRIVCAGKEGFKSTTFFNQTVEVVEVKKVIDWELITLYLLLIAILGAVGECPPAACTAPSRALFPARAPSQATVLRTPQTAQR